MQDVFSFLGAVIEKVLWTLSRDQTLRIEILFDLNYLIWSCTYHNNLYIPTVTNTNTNTTQYLGARRLQTNLKSHWVTHPSTIYVWLFPIPCLTTSWFFHQRNWKVNSLSFHVLNKLMKRILSTTSCSLDDKKRPVQGQLRFNFMYPTHSMTVGHRRLRRGFKVLVLFSSSLFPIFQKTLVLFYGSMRALHK